MKLPTANPPANWVVRDLGPSVLLTRKSPLDQQGPSLTTVLIGSLLVFITITGFRVLTASVPATEVLATPVTFVILMALLLPAAMLFYLRARAANGDAILLDESQLAKRSRLHGVDKQSHVPRSNVLRVIQSRPRYADGRLYGGGSVEVEFRAEGGATEELSLMHSRDEAEVLWFVQLLEAWSGQRARVEDLEIDEDDADPAP